MLTDARTHLYLLRMSSQSVKRLPILLAAHSAAAVLATTLALAAATASAQQAVVPVRKVVMPKGGRYFALPVRVGSKTLEAAIDSGSTGLRVLSPRLGPSDYRSLDQPSHITFLSGTTLAGYRARATLGFGARRGAATIEVIDHLACGSFAPNCAEGHMPIRQMGLMGNAKPGQGAPAIIGLGRADIPVSNPFLALGVKRWIMDMPNDLGDGRIVLDPAPASLAGFVSFPPPIGPDGKPMNDIRGCLRNDRTGQKICGVIGFDTGAGGITVSSPQKLPSQWPRGTPASLLYQDDTGRTRLVQRFRTGDRKHSTGLHFDNHPHGRQTLIHANISPYFCFDVLYTANNGPIALRPRRSGPNDPHASRVE